MKTGKGGRLEEFSPPRKTRYAALLLLFVCYLVALPIRAAAAGSSSLCKADEEVYFSCRAKSKTISLCGSQNATEADGYVVYRYGKIGTPPELEYPPLGSAPPGQFFVLGIASGAKGGSEQLAFNSGDVQYTLFSNHWAFDEPSESAGVLVEKAGKRLALLSCVEPLAPQDLYNLGKDEFGLKGRAKPHFVGLPAGEIRCIAPQCN